MPNHITNILEFDCTPERFREVAESLNSNPDATPGELLPIVKKDIDAFVGEAPQFDDITMLGFKYLGNK